MIRIVTLGAGRMGRGIAHVFAYAGYNVVILDFKERTFDASAALLKEAKDEIHENLEFLKSLEVVNDQEIDNTLSRISVAPLSEAGAVLEMADYVFEGVPEMLIAKRDALERLSKLIRPNTIVASTTSTMLSPQLAKFMLRPSHFLNAHFLNPAYLIPLVEVSDSEYTDPEVTQQFISLLEGIGKVPVRCKASAGYIVPRLQSLMMTEACRMVEQGIASAEDIDRAVTSGFGVRFAAMGPLEFVDWGGLDILYYANSYLCKELGERFKVPGIVEEQMKKGNLGLKTGKGIYNFSGIDIKKYKTKKMANFVALLKHMDLMPKSQ